MKVRIRGNSIRLRLKRAEVDRIASGQSVEERTHFAGAVLVSRLEVCANAEFSADFDGSAIVVSVPETAVARWAEGDEVSLYAEQATPQSDRLTILIEKDFSCLEPGHHRNCEDDEDTFPHPARARDLSA